MGHGNYSHEAHEALLAGRAARPAQEVFRQRECHPLMNPRGVRVRESRDSTDHPRSLGIVFALWLVPGFWKARAESVAAPFLFDQWALMIVIAFGITLVLKKTKPKPLFPYIS